MLAMGFVAQSHDISVSGSVEKVYKFMFGCVEERGCVLESCCQSGRGDWKEELAGSACHRLGGPVGDGGPSFSEFARKLIVSSHRGVPLLISRT